MFSTLVFSVFILSLSLMRVVSSQGQGCRYLEFEPESFGGKRLINHVIRITDVMDEEFCGALCFMEPNCVSYNFKLLASPTGVHKCELNNSTHKGHEEDLKENPNYLYRGAKSACVNSRCQNNAICQAGFTDRKYRCLCTAGFTGEDCESDINECTTGTHKCSADAACSNTKGSYNCSCNPGFYGDGRDCQDIDECATGTHKCAVYDVCNNTQGSHNCTPLTCKERYLRNLSRESIAYEQIAVSAGKIVVYCELNDTVLGPCSDHGIWTLVMKIDGSMRTFHYDSAFWSNKETFNVAGGETGFDLQETKLPTYWNTSFSKICLGMKIHGEDKTNFILINKTADSLFSMIADGQYRSTSMGRDTWKALIGSQASLQLNCNKEGFNAVCSCNTCSRVRIGIITNNENNCDTCPDSRLGFGTGGSPDDSITCGNAAVHDTDNGNKYIKTMGYILVQ